jgi:ADP-ribosyl-[dinitrogen reductase] hydrolase
METTYFLHNDINCFKSALIGFLVGDALGVPVEFRSRNYLKENPISDMIGYGTYAVPKGVWSDDSSLTLILLENLIGGYDPQELARNFCSWYFEGYWSATTKPFDVGIATLQAIRKLKEGVSYKESGCINEDCNGNGSLMRILPLVFYTKNFNIVERLAMIREVSSITHAHLRSIICCVYYVELMQIMMNMSSTPFLEVLSKHQENMKTIWPTYAFDEAEKPFFNRLLNSDFSVLEEGEIQSTGYVIHTLEASIWCCVHANSYKQAVLKAVHLGGDTDTIGAITGSIAGLYYGFNSIPIKWIQNLAFKEKIEKLFKKIE